MLNTVIAFLPEGGSLIIILIVVLLVFGGKKIPELMHDFKDGMTGTDKDKKEDKKDDDQLKP